ADVNYTAARPGTGAPTATHDPVSVFVAPEEIEAALPGVAELPAQAEAGGDLVLDAHGPGVLAHAGDGAEALGVADVELVSEVAPDLEARLAQALRAADLQVQHVQGELTGERILELP